MNSSGWSFRPRTFAIFFTGLAAGCLVGWSISRYAGNEAAAASEDGNGSPNHGGEMRDRRRPEPRGVERTAGSSPVSAAESKAFADSVRSIFRETVEERRMAMFQSLLERTGPEHYAVVVSLIRENDLKGSGSAGEWSKLWASWGTRDPIGAMEYIRTQNWSGWSDQAPLEAKNRTLTFWAQTDPESARRFVEESSEIASGDRSFVSGLVRGWSNVDPAGAAQWLFKSGLGMRDEYGAVVEAISRKGGPEALDAWFSGINQAGAPAKDISGFAQIIVQNKQAYQPEKAAAWVEQHLGEPWVAESEIVRSTAHFFASQDPANAMAWAQRTGLESASTMAMSTWCQRDLPAASQWLKENESSPSYSTAASVLGMYLQRNDPAAAKAFAESISNGSVRERVLRQIQGN